MGAPSMTLLVMPPQIAGSPRSGLPSRSSCMIAAGLSLASPLAPGKVPIQIVETAVFRIDHHDGLDVRHSSGLCCQLTGPGHRAGSRGQSDRFQHQESLRVPGRRCTVRPIVVYVAEQFDDCNRMTLLRRWKLMREPPACLSAMAALWRWVPGLVAGSSRSHGPDPPCPGDQRRPPRPPMLGLRPSPLWGGPVFRSIAFGFGPDGLRDLP